MCCGGLPCTSGRISMTRTSLRVRNLNYCCQRKALSASGPKPCSTGPTTRASSTSADGRRETSLVWPADKFDIPAHCGCGFVRSGHTPEFECPRIGAWMGMWLHGNDLGTFQKSPSAALHLNSLAISSVRDVLAAETPCVTEPKPLPEHLFLQLPKQLEAWVAGP